MFNTQTSSCDFPWNVDCNENFKIENQYVSAVDLGENCPLSASSSSSKSGSGPKNTIDFCQQQKSSIPQFLLFTQESFKFKDPKSPFGYYECFYENGESPTAESIYATCSGWNCFSENLKSCVGYDHADCAELTKVLGTQTSSKSSTSTSGDNENTIYPPLLPPHEIQNFQFNKCELAKQLINTHGFNRHVLIDWICILTYLSHLKTNAISADTKNFGMFQLSSEFWCKNGDLDSTRIS